MRVPAADYRGASVASPPVSYLETPARLFERPVRSFTSQESALFSRVSPALASSESVVCGVSQHLAAPKRKTATMAPHVDPKRSELNEHETHLADKIASAMYDRPLMSRLERVGAAYAPPPLVPNSAPRAAIGPNPAMTPPPIPGQQRGVHLSATGMGHAPVDGFFADNDDVPTSPPPSAEWLKKARRERSRARRSNAAAWLATLAIGGAIISTTMLVLQS